MSYKDLGFDENFVRTDPNQDEEDKDMLINMLLAGTTANNVSGGVMTSINGQLSIDLNQGSITYNNGTQNIFSLGGSANDLTIANDQGNNVVSTTGSTNILNTIIGAALTPTTGATQTTSG